MCYLHDLTVTLLLTLLWPYCDLTVTLLWLMQETASRLVNLPTFATNHSFKKLNVQHMSHSDRVPQKRRFLERQYVWNALKGVHTWVKKSVIGFSALHTRKPGLPLPMLSVQIPARMPRQSSNTESFMHEWRVAFLSFFVFEQASLRGTPSLWDRRTKINS